MYRLVATYGPEANGGPVHVTPAGVQLDCCLSPGVTSSDRFPAADLALPGPRAR